jgi:FKBP-type peptidyl-prolyl cis-trans isomerase FklB
MSSHRYLGSALALLLFATSVGRARAQDAPAALPGATNPAAPAAPAAPAESADPAAASYSIGLYVGSQLRGSGLEGTLSVEQLQKGLHDGLGGKIPTEDDKARMSQMMHTGKEAVASQNRAQAKDFLAHNGKDERVVTTASGLQYTILKPGDATATAPKITDTVTVHYRGRLLDGSQFDSSDAHAMPATFRINGGVIKGWQEALQLMKPGAQWRLFVPPELAYDSASRPGIPPGSLLVFDLELLRIEPPQTLLPNGAPPKGSGAHVDKGTAAPHG